MSTGFILIDKKLFSLRILKDFELPEARERLIALYVYLVLSMNVKTKSVLITRKKICELIGAEEKYFELIVRMLKNLQFTLRSKWSGLYEVSQCWLSPADCYVVYRDSLPSCLSDIASCLDELIVDKDEVLDFDPELLKLLPEYQQRWIKNLKLSELGCSKNELILRCLKNQFTGKNSVISCW